MPPTNPARRKALTDAAIKLLASSGVHGLTHRAVEKEADLPPGTASNYFRSREALLVAAAERIAELHHADTDRATEQPATLVDLLTESLLTAATTLRNRYLAIFELQLEAVRRPLLASALAGLQDTSLQITAGHHDKLGLAIPREKIPALIALYGGALFTLVTAPPGSVSRDVVQSVVQVIVYGCAPHDENPESVWQGRHT
ncbi:TetR/AcrR family transcriptional regulator [Nonomuraea basaltis]|uniref:TetR/AcrR family transcriptional regulator n=1 Tax=Nonomuraea basaltis TaxID=2495887 RepID=UPI00110C42E1|nr:TetR family transcriptional regulator [Nonomuraea basaltis]TMR90914.1 TetR family transcriptional regulator [Nonomuraea basaltis]